MDHVENPKRIMKEDIQFHQAENVFIAAIKEWNEDFTSQSWNVYLINKRTDTISTVLVLSRGKSDDRKTSTLRHLLGDIPPKSTAKIEFIATEVLGFTNEYLLTFFADNRLYERNFVFNPGVIDENKVVEIPLMDTEGILAQ